jgi:hypothetical protein
MKASDIPSKFPIPFAASAGGSYKRAVPTASQIGVNDGWASLTDGFPPLNFQPIASGGVPPFGQDMNGVLNQSTSWDRWYSAGGPLKWDSAFSTSIGGYPNGAIVAAASIVGNFWLCTVDDNVTNPDAGGAGWVGFTLGAPNAGSQVPTASQRLTATLAAAATSINFTADYVAVAASLGASSYTIPNINLTLNAATTGAGGMDTGSIPASGFLSIYLIYNPTTQTAALLGTTASQSTIYGGANLPSGYTASALIGIWPVSTSQMVAGAIIDRVFYYRTGPTAVSSASATSWTSVNLTSYVPAVARQLYGFFRATETGTVNSNSGANFGSFNTSAGFQVAVAALIAGAANYYTGWLPLTTSQTTYYQVGQASMQATLVVEGYSL